MDASGGMPTSRHLGLDLGGTNIKWAIVERDPDAWRVLDRDQVATPQDVGPEVIVPRLAEVGAQALRRVPGVTTVGIGIPGLYDPATGTTRFLVNIPGAWAGYRVAGPVGDALGLPVALINDARAFGLAERIADRSRHPIARPGTGDIDQESGRARRWVIEAGDADADRGHT